MVCVLERRCLVSGTWEVVVKKSLFDPEKHLLSPSMLNHIVKIVPHTSRVLEL